jgi:hypothetical protein
VLSENSGYITQLKVQKLKLTIKGTETEAYKINWNLFSLNQKIYFHSHCNKIEVSIVLYFYIYTWVLQSYLRRGWYLAVLMSTSLAETLNK